MRQYVFSKKAEKDLIEIYRYGFLNHNEQKAELYTDHILIVRIQHERMDIQNYLEIL
jgi:plasmid stabilization system protein ParE